MSKSTTNNGSIVGIPFWVLFSILLPGFAILFLWVPLLEDLGIGISLKRMSDIEKIITGIFLGFLFYTLPAATYVKKYIKFYKNTIEPLRQLITEEKKISCSLKFPDRHISIDDTYHFHNEFVNRLKERNVPIITRDYGYFIFAIFLATIFLFYLPIRLATIIFFPITMTNGELIKLIFLSLLTVYLLKDARDSIKIYFRNICRLVIIHEDIAAETIKFIREKGTDYIRPSPGIDYP
ncbi:MAG: hypothetical protein ACE5KE_14255 [Methanosarcinales archaeon]